jgi:hypothetical protein
MNYLLYNSCLFDSGVADLRDDAIKCYYVIIIDWMARVPFITVGKGLLIPNMITQLEIYDFVDLVRILISRAPEADDISW